MKKKLIELYLDWTNNWFSTGKMADYYGFDTADMQLLIELGRKCHEENLNNE